MSPRTVEWLEGGLGQQNIKLAERSSPRPSNITLNLEAALRRLRSQKEPRRFWIDMICIDQTCEEERTHQVNLMQAIYSGAREVFAWFGDCHDTAFQLAGSAPSVTIERVGFM